MKGSITVEMSFLMPVIFMIFVLCVQGAFYFHDKNILSGAAYEASVVASTKLREEVPVTEAQIVSLCNDRIQGKCILFGQWKTEVTIGEKELTVSVRANKRYMRISVEKRAAITRPEKKIRDIRRLKEIGNGTKSND